MSFIISSQSLKLIIEITYFFSQAYRINFLFSHQLLLDWWILKFELFPHLRVRFQSVLSKKNLSIWYEVDNIVYLSDWKAKLNPAGNLSSWTFPLGKTLRGEGVVGTPGRAVVVVPAPDSLKIPAKWPARFPANNSGFWLTNTRITSLP